MSQHGVDNIMEIWAASFRCHGSDALPPFSNHQDLLDAIDRTDHGEAPWYRFSIQFSGTLPYDDPPSWMQEEYDVWFCDPRTVLTNMLKNKDFDGEFDYSPYKEFKGAKRRYQNLFSGDWAWKQAVSLFPRNSSIISDSVRMKSQKCPTPRDVCSFRSL